MTKDNRLLYFNNLKCVLRGPHNREPTIVYFDRPAKRTKVSFRIFLSGVDSRSFMAASRGNAISPISSASRMTEQYDRFTSTCYGPTDQLLRSSVCCPSSAPRSLIEKGVSGVTDSSGLKVPGWN
jgi:hypothetical protein